MGTTLVIVVACIVGAVVAIALVSRQIMRRKHEAEKRARDRVAGEEIELVDDMANFFGVESSGAAQVRGNGCLVLAAKHLVFAMWVPRREIVIARDRITGIETPRSFLGKTKGVKLLQVSFRNDRDAEDSAAWIVRRLEQWRTALDGEKKP